MKASICMLTHVEKTKFNLNSPKHISKADDLYLLGKSEAAL